jgi:hypothetical protein
MKRVLVLAAGMVAALSVLGLSDARVSVPADTNLAPDPTFESSPYASYYTWDPASYSWAVDAARSPTHSLKIVSTRPAGAMTRWMTNTTAVTAAGGTTYTGSVYLKTAGAHRANLSLTFWNAPVNYLGLTAYSQAVSGTRDWTQVSVQAKAPAGTAHVRIEFRLFGPGTRWGDDVNVVAGAAPPPGGGRLANLTPPQLSGTARQGATLTTSDGTWSGGPTRYSPKWFRCDAAGGNCVVIGTYPGGEALGGSDVRDFERTHLLDGADVGTTTLRSEITACRQTASGTECASTRSAPTALVTATTGLPTIAGAPQILGPIEPALTFTAAPGTWTGAQSTAYQWLKCVLGMNFCSPIAGATGSTFRLPWDSERQALRVLVTATNAAGTVAHGSERLIYEPPVTVYELPSISGTAKVGSTLRAVHGTWTGIAYDSTSVKFDWKRCDANGCVAVAGASDSSNEYVVAAADAGSRIRVVVRISRLVGNPLTMTEIARAVSPPTKVVMP